MRPTGALSPLLPVACRRSASLAKCSAVLQGVAQTSLKVHRWVEGHLHGACYLTDGLEVQMLSCLLLVDVVLCFYIVRLCSVWQIQQIRDCPLVNTARPSGLPLLCYDGVQSGTLHVECICVGRDAVAPLWNRCFELFPRAALFNQWHARGRELSMIRILIW
jgi:hypothetical protein